MERKTFNLIETKANGDGSFTALASVFGNVDHVGDRMMPGAFAKTLERWRSSGDPIPVILSHQWEDPNYVVGKADPRAVYEDERGLVVQGQLDLSNPIGKQVHKLMKERLLKGWSFGYTVPQGGQGQKNGANEVTEVDLVEVGPTLKGANPEAHLEAIKSALEEEREEETESDERALWVAAFEDGLPEDLSKDVRDRLAQKALEVFGIEDAADEEPSEAKSQAQDPLRTSHDCLAFEQLTEGIDMAEPPQVKEEPKSELPSLKDLERAYHDLMLETLI